MAAVGRGIARQFRLPFGAFAGDRSPVRPPCRIVALLLAAGLFTTAMRQARADGQADLEKARSAYLARRYEDAEQRLRALLDAQTGGLDNPDAIADARMYLGAVLLAEKKTDEASGTFEKLLLDKPDYQPDPLRVALEAIDALIDARTRLKERLAAIQAEKVRLAEAEKVRALLEKQKAEMRIAMLERLAGEEVVTEKNSRWIALLPFGVGQFQNGQTALGYTLLASEGLLGAGSIVGAALTLYNSGLTQEAAHRGDGTAAGYNARAQQAAIVGDVFGGTFLLAAAIGIAHAELTFVPERTIVKKRELPPVTLAPLLGPGGIAVVGTF
jgi:hypothetical protein